MIEPIPWSDEEMNFLADGFGRGWLAARIYAEHQAAGFPKRTKNAIIGRLHRSGLTRPHDRMGIVAATIKATKTAKRIERKREVVVQQPVVEEVVVAEPEPELGVRRVHPVPDGDPVREPRQIALHELEANDCRWPYGDADFTFCGLPKAPEVPNSPYCEKHLARSTTSGYRR